jgi:hypothetical protein
MVSVEPIWKDPQEEIARLAAEREVRGLKKELRERNSRRGLSVEPAMMGSGKAIQIIA